MNNISFNAPIRSYKVNAHLKRKKCNYNSIETKIENVIDVFYFESIYDNFDNNSFNEWRESYTLFCEENINDSHKTELNNYK